MGVQIMLFVILKRQVTGILFSVFPPNWGIQWPRQTEGSLSRIR